MRNERLTLSPLSLAQSRRANARRLISARHREPRLAFAAQADRLLVLSRALVIARAPNRLTSPKLRPARRPFPERPTTHRSPTHDEPASGQRRATSHAHAAATPTRRQASDYPALDPRAASPTDEPTRAVLSLSEPRRLTKSALRLNSPRLHGSTTLRLPSRTDIPRRHVPTHSRTVA